MAQPPEPAHPHDEAAAKHGDKQARKRDPHGVAPAEKAAGGKPAGAPTSDRHDTETSGRDAGNGDG